MINQHRFNVGQFSQKFSQFTLKGQDVLSFLQAQSTFDLRLLLPNQFHLTSFLDPQGRMECYGWLLHGQSEFYFLVPLAIKDLADDRLNRFLISEDVTMENESAEWNFIVGLNALEFSGQETFQGEMFSDSALLTQNKILSLPEISSEDVNLWQHLNGWPSLDGKDFAKEIINNNRLFDLSVSSNKGCYPGQETVSKIATRRGAAYSPVLLETQQAAQAGVMSIEGNKIGTVTTCHEWQGKFYLSADVLRDFRVDRMKLKFEINQQTVQATVKYYPLLPGDREAKASELFYAGSDAFRVDDLLTAEECFRQAIGLNPAFADAYESLGVMLGRQERFNEAIDLMKQLSQVDPDSVLAHTNLSLYLMKLGKIEEAEEQKSHATLKSFKKFGQEAKDKESLQNEEKKLQSEWAQREDMFRQVLEIDPEDTLANYGLGSIAVEKKSWNEARIYLEKVLAADPKYSVAYLALGRTYAALGMKKEARDTFAQGIKIAAAKGDMMPANSMQSEMDRI